MNFFVIILIFIAIMIVLYGLSIIMQAITSIIDIRDSLRELVEIMYGIRKNM